MTARMVAALIWLFSFQEGDPVTLLSATADKPAVRPGDIVRITVKVQIEEPWHLYSTTTDPKKTIPTTLNVETQGVERAGKVEESPPKKADLFGEMYDVHEGEATFLLPLRVGRVPPGPLKIRGKLIGQACTNKCVDVEIPFAVDVNVVGSPVQKKGEVEIVSAAADPEGVRPGDVVKLRIRVKIAEPWHLYSVTSDPAKTKPTVFELDPAAPLERAGVPTESKPKMWEFAGGSYPVHEGEAEFEVPLRITSKASPGTLVVKGRLTGQVCTNVCKDVDVPFETRLEVAAVRGRAPKVQLLSAVRRGDVVEIRLEVTPQEFRPVAGSASVMPEGAWSSGTVEETSDGWKFPVKGDGDVKGTFSLKVAAGRETHDAKVAFKIASGVLDDLDAALVAAKRDGRPIFLEFTAFT